MLIKRKRKITVFLMTAILLLGDVMVHGAESETELVAESESESESESEAELVTESESESESESETELMTESESESESESETELVTESESEPETESETELMTESESESESESDSETESEAELVIESESESESESEPETESETELVTESESESESESEPETESETELVTESESETESETDSETEFVEIGIFQEAETESEENVEQLMEQFMVMMEAVQAETLAASPQEIDKVYKTTGQKLAASAEQFIPTVASVNGEWQILGLVRSGQQVSDTLYEKYLANVVSALKQNQGVLHKKKYTEYSRLILALTALGEDVTNIGGYNLLEPLADFDKTVWQGINGAIFALLAFDSHNYEIPTVAEGKTQTTRVLLINHILSKEINGGGFALSGSKADPDMTAMAVQALVPYYDKSEPVKKAVDRAVKKLSEMQMATGGYGSFGVVNVESCAQVIVALTALGIDPENDERFIKNGNTVMDALLGYSTDDGAFEHIEGGGADQMATEQAYYAMTAYTRFQEGKTSLYDMSEIALASDYKRAEEIDALIEMLPDKVTLQDEEQIQHVQNAYQKLTELQKTLVAKVNSEKLQAAIKTLEALQEEAEDETESESETETEQEMTTESETEKETAAESESETEKETINEPETETEQETEEEIYMIAESEAWEEIGMLIPDEKQEYESESEEDLQQITEKNTEEETEAVEETESPKKPMGTTLKVDLVTHHPGKTTTKVKIVTVKKEVETESETETETATETETEKESESNAETESESESNAETEEEVFPGYAAMDVSRELLSEELMEEETREMWIYAAIPGAAAWVLLLVLLVFRRKRQKVNM